MDSFPEIEIAEYKVFDERYDNNGNTLNISYGIDENYLDGVGVSITSVLIHNDINVAFHIICDKYTQSFVDKIEALVHEHKIKISLYLINVKCLEVLPKTQVWSRAMYFRLFAFDYLHHKLDKLLYLDADVICKGSLDYLLDLDLNDNVAAVVKDVDSIQYRVNERLPSFNLQGQYFNSGVVLINLRQWAENQLTARALSLLTGNDGNATFFKYPDQDVLNILLRDKVYFLPREYNTIYTIKSELNDKTHEKYLNVIHADTKLIHYTGATKPWHAWANYPSVIYYTTAFIKSPWKDVPAKDARTMVEYKKRYKHLLVQKHYLRGVIAGAAYLYRKILAK
ncbi:lipopolysaccharide 1,2-glucosyltransferase [Citrobacter amalonaticus]|uniref:glycosyltransferase family 8 protein n=1 Tax=Citrobacter amalonaticus TaxID=35703 RepID=UPI00215CCCF8|nr:glycosyltransferase [Citrobacter amalonaticus]MCR9028790.1 lipopolysaccharide 1,2-glucosyltransferase [Citrobacter amalonaticus]